jgi:hypothetical protein
LPLDYVHRRTASDDIYFIRNTTGESLSTSVRLRVRGRRVEQWDPVSGARRALAATAVNGLQQVTMRLSPHGSTMLVCRTMAPGAESGDQAATDGTTTRRPEGESALRDRESSLTLSGPWSVEFATEGGSRRTTMPALVSWTTLGDPEIRYFSGIARYTAAFELTPVRAAAGSHVVLSLGRVEAVARVRINGRPCGVAWTDPWSVDVTPAVRPGRNLVQIEVANLWPNALIGDAKRPKDQRRYHTNITKLPNAWMYLLSALPSDKYPLRESGLLGPVVIEIREDGHVRRTP